MFSKLRYPLAAVALAAAVPLAAQGTGISAERLTETVRTLASDTFEGRAPGTIGEQRTLGYLIARFQAAGLEPGGASGGP